MPERRCQAYLRLGNLQEEELSGSMKLSVIGSEGSLGRALCRALEGNYEVRRADVNCPNEPNALRADMRSQEDMERAVDGADIVVPLAAYHGGYNPPPTDETRFDVNVVGTFRVFQACLKKNIRRVVWASSDAALHRNNMYCISKVIGEDLCDYYHEAHGFQIAMMRYSAFTPCDLATYGQRLLSNAIDKRDCVEATVKAIDLLAKGHKLFGRYMVLPVHPYTADEQSRFGRDWQEIVRKSDPAYVDLIKRYKIQMPPALTQADVSSTAKDLGFTPRYNFDTFLAELKQRDATREVTPESPRWWFEQGVKPPEGIVWPRQEGQI